MAKQAVDWVGLSDVALAADRGMSPLGPELCGFILLEATSRLREVGGGAIEGQNLAVGTQGHVALTAPPTRASEAEAVASLRALLAALLGLATSSTPALRQCARRQDPRSTCATFERELFAALIPLNRQASRRGLARLARSTLDALENGQLENGAELLPGAGQSAEPSPLPVTRKVSPRVAEDLARAAAPASRAVTPAMPAAVPAAKAAPAEPVTQPTPAVAPSLEESDPFANAVEAKPEIVEVDEPTVQQPTVIQRAPRVVARVETPEPVDARAESPTPPTSLHELSDALDALEGHGDEMEIVSQLPPLVEEVASKPLEEPVPTARPTVPEAARPTVTARDRVRELVEGFSVSRERDDRALSADLKAMVGIETSMPPQVARRDDAAPVDLDFGEPSPLPAAATLDDRPPMRRGPSLLFAVALAAAVFVVATAVTRPGMVSSLLIGPAAPPPGATRVETPMASPAAAPALPASCEGTLTVENAPKDGELLRRIGVAPSSVVVPIGAPVDLVATLEGHTPQRLRVDKAMFKGDATGLSAQASFTFDATAKAVWTAPTLPATPLRADGARALLKLASTPASASVWAVVDPAAVPVPCGSPVDLLSMSKGGPQGWERKSFRVEWTSFSGSPPRGTLRM